MGADCYHNYMALDLAITSTIQDGGGTNILQCIFGPSHIEATHTMAQLAMSSISGYSIAITSSILCFGMAKAAHGGLS